MKISEITESDVVRYIRAGEDTNTDEMEAIMDAAKQYISGYVGLPVTSEDPEVETLDSHEDMWIAFMVLCQDMYDNRALMTEGGNVNHVVSSVLDMHRRNLV